MWTFPCSVVAATLCALFPASSGQVAPAPVIEDLAELDAASLVDRLPWVDDWSTVADGRRQLVPVAEEVWARAREHRLPDDQWRRLLLEKGVLRYHPRWCADRPFAVSMRALPVGEQIRISLDPVREGLGDASCGNLRPMLCGLASMSILHEELCQELGVLPLGRHDLGFDVLVESEPESWWTSPGGEAPLRPVLWRGTLSIEVEVVESLAGAIAPVADADVDGAVRSALSLEFLDRGWSQPRAQLRVQPDSIAHPQLRDLGLSLELQVLRRGFPVGEPARLAVGDYGMNSDWSFDAFGVPGDSVFLEAVHPGLITNVDARDLLSVRVRGTGEGLERLWHARRHWSGELEIPLVELMEPGPK
ncbi:hypothetical protein [Engelhardtia mirabilis]|uniref:Uncharacterized protein n=1 Tax=Engelhardtia mirabilis TaxID=2528011 RepID=A0A518BKY1_9BACT|nr:hypothetical protein Pla133_27160 [Planctomycetes bacterium Pla133]QDV01954.1 hypothetical protein Pla86_27150 [Planctomycetes bacterium Pla86]